MKLDPDTIAWIEDARDSLCQSCGYGKIVVIWHIKEGKIDGVEKHIVQTEKGDCIDSAGKEK